MHSALLRMRSKNTSSLTPTLARADARVEKEGNYMRLVFLFAVAVLAVVGVKRITRKTKDETADLFR